MQILRDSLTRLRCRLALRHHSELLFNALGTHVPSRRVREWWLRSLGAAIGENVAIFRGTTVLDPARLRIADNCAIGWRCVLDARGGLEIGTNVSIASDCQLITAKHDINDPGFPPVLAPIAVRDRVWIATGSMVLLGVTVDEGAVVAAGAIVTGDVDAYTVVGGSPARPIAKRSREQTYTINFRPRFY